MKVFPQAVVFSVTEESRVLPVFKEAVVKIHQKQKSDFIAGQYYRDLAVAYTEGMANAIRHAEELEKKGSVQCRLAISARQVEIRIEDHGPGFNLNRVPVPKFRKLSESGRGVFMMRQLMDTVQYRRGKGKNTLILKRNLVGTDRQARDLDLLYEISSAVLESSDIASVYRVILDKAVEVFGVERASILSYDPAENRLQVIASRGLTQSLSKAVQVRPGEGISGYVFQHSKPCLIEDIEKNASGWKKKKKYKSRSFISAPMICSPMRLGQKTIGVINMTDRKDRRPFTKKDLKLLTTIANQASAYLHMSQLLAQARDAKLLRRELEIARQIQRSYLPKLPPRVEGLDIAGWCETAQSVGGDYYDWILKDPNTLYVAIADVSGHNIAAAMAVVNLRSQLKNLLLTVSDPGELLNLLNSNLFDDLSKNDQFITLFLLRYQVREGRVEFSNAGHRLPLIVNRSGVSSPSRMSDSGAALGAVEREEYGTKVFSLNTGEGLILYTDGVTEAADASGRRLGSERLVEILKPLWQADAQSVVQTLQAELARFRGSAPVTDDVTAVYLKRVNLSEK